MEFVNSFRELTVYKLARKLSLEIFATTQSFPKEEMYSLTDQIRRCSRSIGAQIAEAWSKRRYEKHFTSKLCEADGEQLETQHWIGTALDSKYISDEKAADPDHQCQIIGKMLYSMINKADRFALKTK
jgi:four helix bundle protein